MKLYKFKSLNDFDRVLDIIVCERLYCAPYRELNDPFEGMLDIKFQSPFPPNSPLIDPINELTAHTHTEVGEFQNPDGHVWRICSLSSTIEDIRMWGLYGDSFKGVAIEIELDDATPQLYPVTYSPLPPLVLDPNTTDFDPIDCLTSKVEQWSYENEQRIITTNVFHGVEGKITGLYLGTRVSKAHKAIFNALNLDVPVRDTYLDKTKLKVYRTDDDGNCL